MLVPEQERILDDEQKAISVLWVTLYIKVHIFTINKMITNMHISSILALN